MNREHHDGKVVVVPFCTLVKHLLQIPQLEHKNNGLAKQFSQPESGCSFETQGAHLGRMFQALSL